jgi:hypothetical protein
MATRDLTIELIRVEIIRRKKHGEHQQNPGISLESGVQAHDMRLKTRVKDFLHFRSICADDFGTGK